MLMNEWLPMWHDVKATDMPLSSVISPLSLPVFFFFYFFLTKAFYFVMIAESHTAIRNKMEILFTLYPISSNDNILQNYSTIS